MVGLLKGIALYGSIILGLNAIGNIETDEEKYVPEDSPVVIEEVVEIEESKQEEIVTEVESKIENEQVVEEYIYDTEDLYIEDIDTIDIHIPTEKEYERERQRKNAQLPTLNDIVKENRAKMESEANIVTNNIDDTIEADDSNIGAIGAHDEINTLPTIDDDDIVYWNGGSSSSNKYHKSAGAHGMKGAVKMTRQEAREKGYVACKSCY
jgi:hypothetical protein